MRDLLSPLLEDVAAALDWYADIDGRDTSTLVGTGAVGLAELAAARFAGTSRSILMPNATTGLLAALLALDIGPGDDVVVPAFDWPGTAAAVRTIGGRPVFADVAAGGGVLSADMVAAAVTGRTAAVIVTHLAGQLANTASVMARVAPIPVIEDRSQAHAAAAAFPTAGRAVVTSFGPGKVLSADGAACLSTSDQELANRIVGVSQHPLRLLLDGVGAGSRTVNGRPSALAAVLLAHLLHVRATPILTAAAAARRSATRAAAAAGATVIPTVAGTDALVWGPSGRPVAAALLDDRQPGAVTASTHLRLWSAS